MVWEDALERLGGITLQVRIRNWRRRIGTSDELKVDYNVNNFIYNVWIFKRRYIIRKHTIFSYNILWAQVATQTPCICRKSFFEAILIYSKTPLGWRTDWPRVWTLRKRWHQYFYHSRTAFALILHEQACSQLKNGLLPFMQLLTGDTLGSKKDKRSFNLVWQVFQHITWDLWMVFVSLTALPPSRLWREFEARLRHNFFRLLISVRWDSYSKTTILPTRGRDNLNSSFGLPSILSIPYLQVLVQSYEFV